MMKPLLFALNFLVIHSLMATTTQQLNATDQAPNTRLKAATEGDEQRKDGSNSSSAAWCGYSWRSSKYREPRYVRARFSNQNDIGAAVFAVRKDYNSVEIPWSKSLQDTAALLHLQLTCCYSGLPQNSSQLLDASDLILKYTASSSDPTKKLDAKPRTWRVPQTYSSSRPAWSTLSRPTQSSPTPSAAVAQPTSSDVTRAHFLGHPARN